MALIGFFFYLLLCAIGIVLMVVFVRVINNNYRNFSRKTNLASVSVGFASFALACWSILTVPPVLSFTDKLVSFSDSFTIRVYIVSVTFSLMVLLAALMMNTIFSAFISKKIAFSVAMIFNLIFLVGPPIYQVFKRSYALTIFGP